MANPLPQLAEMTIGGGDSAGPDYSWLGRFVQSTGYNAFVVPTLPTNFVYEIKPEPAPLPVAEPVDLLPEASLVTSVIGGAALMLAFPSRIGEEPDVTHLPKFDFAQPETSVLPEQLVSADNAMRPPPPIDTRSLDTAFPNLPPDWNALATEDVGNVFGGTEYPIDFWEARFNNVARWARWIPDAVDLSLRLGDIGKDLFTTGIIYDTGIRPNPDSVRPDTRPSRTTRVLPVTRVPLAQPEPRGYPNPNIIFSPAPHVGFDPYADPFVTPFGDPFAPPAPTTEPQPRTDVQPGTRVGVTFPTGYPTIFPFVTPLGSPPGGITFPISGDPTLEPKVMTDPKLDASPCECTTVKVKKKKPKDKKKRTKCFEYRNREYSDGTVRLQTVEIPCEPRGVKQKSPPKNTPRKIYKKTIFSFPQLGVF